SWRGHGVLAIKTALLGRQRALPVTEHRAVLAIRERSAPADQFIGFPALPGQLGNLYGGRLAFSGAVRQPPGLRREGGGSCQQEASKRKLDGGDTRHERTFFGDLGDATLRVNPEKFQR